MGLKHLGPYYWMPISYQNYFGKLLKFRSVQLLRMLISNENKARKVW